MAPDRSFTTAAGRRRLARHFATFAADFDGRRPVTRSDGIWALDVAFGRIIALPLAALPRIEPHTGGPVLVDIDADYFMIDVAPFRGEYHRPRSRPWI